jgi:hypothetical protein
MEAQVKILSLMIIFISINVHANKSWIECTGHNDLIINKLKQNRVEIGFEDFGGGYHYVTGQLYETGNDVCIEYPSYLGTGLICSFGNNNFLNVKKHDLFEITISDPTYKNSNAKVHLCEVIQ